jgi:hypothetical protein
MRSKSTAGMKPRKSSDAYRAWCIDCGWTFGMSFSLSTRPASKHRNSRMTHEETVAAELKAAGASLVQARAAAENGDWAAAEQGVIDAQEQSEVAMREIQAKLAEPPSPAENLED